ncbi:MAG: PilZ domain-containing protein [Spirochaetales bacterium]|nr:PilZ domain-containing protein [Spirochaetales bacterium]
MNEKRRFDRFLIVIEIDQHRKDDNKNHSKTKSKNISTSGICITTDDDPLIKGEIYVLRFILPEQSKQIIVEGKVIWVHKYSEGSIGLFDNGLEFTKISEEQHNMIEEYRLGSVYEK